MSASPSTSTGQAGSFVFPPFYSFPPFFTRQPVESTYAKQRSLWLDLIRSFCQHHSLPTLNLHAYQSSSSSSASSTASSTSTQQRNNTSNNAAVKGSSDESRLVNQLFRNDAINRCLSLDFIRTLLTDLANDSYGVWSDPSRNIFYITPSKRLDEWASIIWEWMDGQGLIGPASSIMTLYEMQNADHMQDAPFHSLSEPLLFHALRRLEAQGKCAIMAAPILSESGIKFIG